MTSIFNLVKDKEEVRYHLYEYFWHYEHNINDDSTEFSMDRIHPNSAPGRQKYVMSLTSTIYYTVRHIIMYA